MLDVKFLHEIVFSSSTTNDTDYGHSPASCVFCWTRSTLRALAPGVNRPQGSGHPSEKREQSPLRATSLLAAESNLAHKPCQESEAGGRVLGKGDTGSGTATRTPLTLLFSSQLVFCRDCKEAYHAGDCSSLAAAGAAPQVQCPSLLQGQVRAGEELFPEGHPGLHSETTRPGRWPAAVQRPWLRGHRDPSRAPPPRVALQDARCGCRYPRACFPEVHGAGHRAQLDQRSLGRTGNPI